MGSVLVACGGSCVVWVVTSVTCVPVVGVAGGVTGVAVGVVVGAGVVEAGVAVVGVALASVFAAGLVACLSGNGVWRATVTWPLLTG